MIIQQKEKITCFCVDKDEHYKSYFFFVDSCWLHEPPRKIVNKGKTILSSGQRVKEGKYKTLMSENNLHP